MDDLLKLDACRTQGPISVPSILQPVSTPLNYVAWSSALSYHPDVKFRQFILSGISKGFRIGFNRESPLRSVLGNMPSASDQEEALQAYFEKEVAAGHLLGPVPRQSVHISRMGVIPKGHTPGRWRVITDLSHPPGFSVNDGIDPSLCSLAYVSVDTIAGVVAVLGRGSLLAKVDIESAYRLIPVHPEDRPLLGVEWRGSCFCDGMLPFGLRSAPKVFTAFADALEWCIRREGVERVFHYLDDFIIVGPPASDQCQADLESLERTCSRLGVPLAVHKRDGPATKLTFLGIEIDTMEGILRLPEGKLRRLVSTLSEWGDKKVCTRRELESLVGLLNHVCKVVQPGRSFLRRMISLLTATSRSHSSKPFHHIRLNREFRADLIWWRTFVEPWNGVGLMHRVGDPDHVFSSDASGLWGCGAWHESLWFQFEWDSISQDWDISAKELFPILVAVAVWGPLWGGSTVLCHCDNQAVVSVIRSRSCRDKKLMHLLRCLFFFEAYFGIRLQASHVAGINNGAADALLRDNLSLFFSLLPQAAVSPTPLPRELVELLLSPDMDWLSPIWTQRFKATLNKV